MTRTFDIPPFPRPGDGRKACPVRAVHKKQAGRGFTLVELMISIALVLILILGINQVFRISSDTINAGQALSSADRDNRAIQGTLYPDFTNVALNDAPFFIIRSRVQPAFRNRADELADRDGNPLTRDINGDNGENNPVFPGELTTAPVYNSRNHRLDKLIFFSNYMYRRQTGATTGELITDMASNEAYVWYGHLKQPNNTPAPAAANYFLPGEADKGTTNRNDNNRYATDWILGRVVTLLREDPVAGQYRPGGSSPLSPLVESAQAETGNFNFPDRRFDVAQTSITNYRQRVQADIAAPTGPEPWWQVISGFRFYGFPYPTRPLTSAGMARTIPVFVQGCTQFIVEYTGDYLNQDPDTGVINTTVFSPGGSGDGVVDFNVVGGARRTRWYGLPRNVDTSDDGGARGPMVRGIGTAADLLDVVPLRDVLASRGVTPPPTFFERDINNRLRRNQNYGTLVGPGGGRPTSGYTSAMSGTDQTEYVAAWGPDELTKTSVTKPKMIRVTLVVDDPAGRMNDGQTYEYVFKLP